MSEPYLSHPHVYSCCKRVDDLQSKLSVTEGRLAKAEDALHWFTKELGGDIICPCCNTHPHISHCHLKALLEALSPKETSGGDK